MVFRCELCGNIYQVNTSLRRHVIKCHPTTDVESVAPNLKTNLSCKKCSVVFETQSGLRKHAEVHMTSGKVLNFQNFQLFLDWKEKEEKETKSSYFKRSSYSTKNSGVIHLYFCRRSGEFKSKSNGERRLKTQGSCKIGKKCPAKIVAIVLDNGTCSVEYHSQHDSHSADIEHLQLSASEKAMLAQDIAREVLSFSSIMNKVQASAVESNYLEPVHLVKKPVTESAGNNQSEEKVNSTENACSFKEEFNEMKSKNDEKFNLILSSASSISELAIIWKHLTLMEANLKAIKCQEHQVSPDTASGICKLSLSGVNLIKCQKRLLHPRKKMKPKKNAL